MSSSRIARHIILDLPIIYLIYMFTFEYTSIIIIIIYHIVRLLHVVSRTIYEIPPLYCSSEHHCYSHVLLTYLHRDTHVLLFIYAETSLCSAMHICAVRYTMFLYYTQCEMHCPKDTLCEAEMCSLLSKSMQRFFLLKY